MSIIYLYVKQHYITGLKYFGRTKSINPFEYPGSGSYWLKHCNKHGLNYIRTIEVWGFDNQEECTDFVIIFSLENNIIDSKEWANLVLEYGTIGFSTHSEQSKKKLSQSRKGIIFTEQHKANISKANRARPKLSYEACKLKRERNKATRIKNNTKLNEESLQNYRKPKTKQHSENISKARKGIVFTEGHKEKLQQSALKGKFRWITDGTSSKCVGQAYAEAYVLNNTDWIYGRTR